MHACDACACARMASVEPLHATLRPKLLQRLREGALRAESCCFRLNAAGVCERDISLV